MFPVSQDILLIIKGQVKSLFFKMRGLETTFKTASGKPLYPHDGQNTTEVYYYVDLKACT